MNMEISELNFKINDEEKLKILKNKYILFLEQYEKYLSEKGIKSYY